MYSLIGEQQELADFTPSLSPVLGIEMPDSPTINRPPQLGRSTYRVFLLKTDGGISAAEIIEAQSDEEAKAIASNMINGHGVDLWERGRFLASYPPLKVSEGC